MGLLPKGQLTPVSGRILLQDENLLEANEERLRDLRCTSMAMIFQEPMTALNPVMRCGDQIDEVLRTHTRLNKKERAKRIIRIMEEVRLPEPKRLINTYPHQLSGGQRQRIMIAMALVLEPVLLIADEPTTALDVTIQAQILDLVKRLRQELGMAIIWITHDLGVVAGIADRVMVMYGGFVVERAGVKELYSNPKHPYTQALLRTLPDMDGDRSERLESIKGQPPDLHHKPVSCPFAPRCPHVFERCLQANPLLESVADGHELACWWDTATGEAKP